MDYPSLRDPEGEVAVPQVLNEHNLKYRLQAKEYSDRVNHHRLSETKEGDTVLLKNLRPKKHEPVFYTDTHTITRRSGNQVEVERDRDNRLLYPSTRVIYYLCCSYRQRPLTVQLKMEYSIIPLVHLSLELQPLLQLASSDVNLTCGVINKFSIRSFNSWVPLGLGLWLK